MSSNFATRLLIPMLLLSFLEGCVSTGSKGWPVQTYENACHTGMIPNELICLISADIGGFKYPEQFQACRQDMQNYFSALDIHYDCSKKKLRVVFDGLLRSVPDKFNCYVDFFMDKKEGDPSLACPPLEVPNFHHSHEVNGLEISLGVPRCIRKREGYNFAPKSDYSLENCRDQVEVFLGNGLRTNSFDAAAAQSQYDTYIKNLRRVLDSKADDAVRKFNCLADGDNYCF